MPPRRVQPRVADAMTPGEFITKWRASQLKESAASQEHFIDLCRLLGEPTPAEADPTGERYCFERGARKDTGGDGWADVWKRHCFAWEYKGRGTAWRHEDHQPQKGLSPHGRGNLAK